jgi:hypothetical protein
VHLVGVIAVYRRQPLSLYVYSDIPTCYSKLFRLIECANASDGFQSCRHENVSEFDARLGDQAMRSPARSRRPFAGVTPSNSVPGYLPFIIHSDLASLFDRRLE